jgi:nucleotide-binding universal stress UspA family protein
MQTILVPTDFSPHSEKALEVAEKLVKLTGGKIHLLHCYKINVGGISPYGITVPEEFNREVREAAEKRIEDLERKADLIVMGTRGATGLKHILLGSVAERTLRIAPCPVLTVKETDA